MVVLIHVLREANIQCRSALGGDDAQEGRSL
jgi:hypothetical protein